MPIKDDELEIEILDDGTIKTTSPKISAANHSNAAQFLDFLGRLTGGSTTITKNTKHSHSHTHEHVENKG